MKLFFAAVVLATVLASTLATAQTTPHDAALNALAAPSGKILAGTYTGGRSGEEDDIIPSDLKAYIRTVGHRPAWVYFSNNWYRSRAFPAETAKWIRAAGSTPFIRLMLRSDPEQDHADPLYKTRAIARGDFDADLAKWARAAARFKTPILVEWGTEMNGEWFQWNARWNGKQRGAKRFADAYRHIIDVMRTNGASNIIWVFHVNWADGPPRNWNQMEKYYPGDDYIDWLGISLYSMQGPNEDEPTAFSEIDKTIHRLNKMAYAKPIIIAEFGTDVHNPHEPAAPWADKALRQILSGKWPNLIGFSWWNETWPNGDDPADATDTRIVSDPNLIKVFRRHLNNTKVVK